MCGSGFEDLTFRDALFGLSIIALTWIGAAWLLWVFVSAVVDIVRRRADDARVRPERGVITFAIPVGSRTSAAPRARKAGSRRG